MSQTRTSRQTVDGPLDFDQYRSRALECRADAIADFYGATRSAIFNAVRARFHRARAI